MEECYIPTLHYSNTPLSFLEPPVEEAEALVRQELVPAIAKIGFEAFENTGGLVDFRDRLDRVGAVLKRETIIEPAVFDEPRSRGEETANLGVVAVLEHARHKLRPAEVIDADDPATVA